MHQATIEFKQFPIRLDLGTVRDLENMSIKTNITKSQIARIAIARFLKHLNATGAKDAIERACNT